MTACAAAIESELKTLSQQVSRLESTVGKLLAALEAKEDGGSGAVGGSTSSGDEDEINGREGGVSADEISTPEGIEISGVVGEIAGVEADSGAVVDVDVAGC